MQIVDLRNHLANNKNIDNLIGRLTRVMAPLTEIDDQLAEFLIQKLTVVGDTGLRAEGDEFIISLAYHYFYYCWTARQSDSQQGKIPKSNELSSCLRSVDTTFKVSSSSPTTQYNVPPLRNISTRMLKRFFYPRHHPLHIPYSTFSLIRCSKNCENFLQSEDVEARFSLPTDHPCHLSLANFGLEENLNREIKWLSLHFLLFDFIRVPFNAFLLKNIMLSREDPNHLSIEHVQLLKNQDIVNQLLNLTEEQIITLLFEKNLIFCSTLFELINPSSNAFEIDISICKKLSANCLNYTENELKAVAFLLKHRKLGVEYAYFFTKATAIVTSSAQVLYSPDGYPFTVEEFESFPPAVTARALSHKFITRLSDPQGASRCLTPDDLMNMSEHVSRAFTDKECVSWLTLSEQNPLYCSIDAFLSLTEFQIKKLKDPKIQALLMGDAGTDRPLTREEVLSMSENIYQLTQDDFIWQLLRLAVESPNHLFVDYFLHLPIDMQKKLLIAECRNRLLNTLDGEDHCVTLNQLAFCNMNIMDSFVLKKPRLQARLSQLPANYWFDYYFKGFLFSHLDEYRHLSRENSSYFSKWAPGSASLSRLVSQNLIGRLNFYFEKRWIIFNDLRNMSADAIGHLTFNLTHHLLSPDYLELVKQLSDIYNTTQFGLKFVLKPTEDQPALNQIKSLHTLYKNVRPLTNRELISISSQAYSALTNRDVAQFLDREKYPHYYLTIDQIYNISEPAFKALQSRRVVDRLKLSPKHEKYLSMKQVLEISAVASDFLSNIKFSELVDQLTSQQILSMTIYAYQAFKNEIIRSRLTLPAEHPRYLSIDMILKFTECDLYKEINTNPNMAIFFESGNRYFLALLLRPENSEFSWRLRLPADDPRALNFHSENIRKNMTRPGMSILGLPTLDYYLLNRCFTLENIVTQLMSEFSQVILSIPRLSQLFETGVISWSHFIRGPKTDLVLREKTIIDRIRETPDLPGQLSVDQVFNMSQHVAIIFSQPDLISLLVQQYKEFKEKTKYQRKLTENESKQVEKEAFEKILSLSSRLAYTINHYFSRIHEIFFKKNNQWSVAILEIPNPAAWLLQQGGCIVRNQLPEYHEQYLTDKQILSINDVGTKLLFSIPNISTKKLEKAKGFGECQEFLRLIRAPLQVLSLSINCYSKKWNAQSTFNKDRLSWKMFKLFCQQSTRENAFIYALYMAAFFELNGWSPQPDRVEYEVNSLRSRKNPKEENKFIILQELFSKPSTSMGKIAGTLLYQFYWYNAITLNGKHQELPLDVWFQCILPFITSMPNMLSKAERVQMLQATQVRTQVQVEEVFDTDVEMAGPSQ